MKLFLASIAMLLAALGISPLVQHWASPVERWGHFACLGCGCRVRCVSEDGEVIAYASVEERSAFEKRFVALVPAKHGHDWVVDEFGLEPRVTCVRRSNAQLWFEFLPLLSDKAGADALVRESLALSPDARRALIDEFLEPIVPRAWGAEEALVRWRAQRRARRVAPTQGPKLKGQTTGLPDTFGSHRVALG